jgi:diketogulonate reductase-like aldo/keto reductase
MASLSLSPLLWTNRRFVLSNGVSLPAVGLGTFKIRREGDVDVAVRAAVGVSGYKSVDTAAVYRNETFIANTLKTLYIDPKINLKVRTHF